MVLLHLSNKYSYEDMCLAYFDCRKHKRTTHSALNFELNFEYNLRKLQKEINEGNYEIGPSRVFVVTWPKAREVWAALFRDRIVHHLICRDIAPFYESRFIEDSYSCITGKGSLAAILRCNEFARRITQNWHIPGWVLKMDISNFFVSMNKHILWDLLKRHIGETSLTAQLTKQVIFYNPTDNPIITPYSDFSLIPKHKSLWHCPRDNGQAIGNLTSQTFANVYLDELDKFVKHILKVKFYVRYVDDFCIFLKDRERLYNICERIDTFLQHNLKLRLNRNKTKVFPVTSGINYLGHIILPFRMLPRTMLADRARQAVYTLSKNYFDDHAFASVNSYLGLLIHCNAYKIRKEICKSIFTPTIIGYDEKYTKLIKLVA